MAEPVASRRFGLEKIRRQRAEAGLEGADAGGGGGSDRRAVVGAEPGDDLGALRRAAAGVVGAGDLEGELVRFAARIGEGEHRLVAHHDAGEPFRQLRDIDVRDAGIERDELERLDLGGDAAGHFGATMADLAGAEVAAGVEQAMAVLVEDIGTLAADHHLGVAVGILALECDEIGKEVADMALGASAGGTAVKGRRGWVCGHACLS